MIRLLYKFLFLFSIVFVSCAQQGADQSNLDGKAFANGLKKNPDAVLIDVRTPDEFRAGHIPGATLIDYYADDFKKQIEQLDRSKSYYLYCRSGNRSGRTIKLMTGMGFKKVVHLASGIRAWKGELQKGMGR